MSKLSRAFKNTATKGFAITLLNIIGEMPIAAQAEILMIPGVVYKAESHLKSDLMKMVQNMRPDLQTHVLSTEGVIAGLASRDSRNDLIKILKKMNDEDFTNVLVASKGLENLREVLLKPQQDFVAEKMRSLSEERQTRIFSTPGALNNLWGVFQGGHIDLVAKLDIENQTRIFSSEGAVLHFATGFMNRAQRLQFLGMIEKMPIAQKHKILRAEQFTLMHLNDVADRHKDPFSNKIRLITQEVKNFEKENPEFAPSY